MKVRHALATALTAPMLAGCLISNTLVFPGLTGADFPLGTGRFSCQTTSAEDVSKMSFDLREKAGPGHKYEAQFPTHTHTFFVRQVAQDKLLVIAERTTSGLLPSVMVLHKVGAEVVIFTPAFSDIQPIAQRNGVDVEYSTLTDTLVFIRGTDRAKIEAFLTELAEVSNPQGSFTLRIACKKG